MKGMFETMVERLFTIVMVGAMIYFALQLIGPYLDLTSVRMESDPDNCEFIPRTSTGLWVWPSDSFEIYQCNGPNGVIINLSYGKEEELKRKEDPVAGIYAVERGRLRVKADKLYLSTDEGYTIEYSPVNRLCTDKKVVEKGEPIAVTHLKQRDLIKIIISKKILDEFDYFDPLGSDPKFFNEQDLCSSNEDCFAHYGLQDCPRS